MIKWRFYIICISFFKKEEVQKILDTTEFERSFRTNPINKNKVPYFKTKIKIATINSMNATLRCLEYF